MSSCLCTGKCKDLGYCPNDQRCDYRPIDWNLDWRNNNFRLSPTEIKKLEELFENKKKENNFKPCTHPEHNPPTHLCIEPGHYRYHVCPSCKMQFLMSGPPISL